MDTGENRTHVAMAINPSCYRKAMAGITAVPPGPTSAYTYRVTLHYTLRNEGHAEQRKDKILARRDIAMTAPILWRGDVRSRLRRARSSHAISTSQDRARLHAVMYVACP